MCLTYILQRYIWNILFAILSILTEKALQVASLREFVEKDTIDDAFAM